MAIERQDVRIIEESIPAGYSLYNVPLGKRGGDQEVKITRPSGDITISFPVDAEVLHYSFRGGRWIGRKVKVEKTGEEDQKLQGHTYFVYLKY